MKNNITVFKIDMPTLQQMVLENDHRISENKMKIKEMQRLRLLHHFHSIRMCSAHRNLSPSQIYDRQNTG